MRIILINMRAVQACAFRVGSGRMQLQHLTQFEHLKPPVLRTLFSDHSALYKIKRLINIIFTFHYN